MPKLKDDREKWGRVIFQVKMIDDGLEFDSECGQYAHMGVLCCHVLRVILWCVIFVFQFGLWPDWWTIFPYLTGDGLPTCERYIGKTHLKRWMRGARDLLPGNLVQYHRDHLRKRSFTYRHSTLYMKAMELVRPRDASAEAYDKLYGIFYEAIVTMSSFNKQEMGWDLRIFHQNQTNAVDKATWRQQCNHCRIGQQLSRSKSSVKEQGAGRPSSRRTCFAVYATLRDIRDLPAHSEVMNRKRLGSHQSAVDVVSRTPTDNLLQKNGGGVTGDITEILY